MTEQNYARTISVSATPLQAYDALTTGYAHWWTTPDKPLKEVGDRAKFTFPPGISYWTFEASRLIPGKLVDLECVDALHKHEGQPREIETEWLGTKVICRFDETRSGTDIYLEHIGLTRNLHCFEICEAGWDFFFLDSLKAYLDTGIGMPHRAPA